MIKTYGQSITEKSFQKTVILRAKRLGCFVAKMEAVGQAGFPDLLLIYRGRSLYLELKSPKGTGKLSALQVHMHEQLRAAGAWVEVAQDMYRVEELLKELTGC
jgi:hypothetical protein